MKEYDNLRGVVHYHAVNIMTKRNNAPIPKSDENLDQIGGAKVFRKIDLKTGFLQGRMKPEALETLRSLPNSDILVSHDACGRLLRPGDVSNFNA